MVMADSVMLFPQLLQPTAALKTYAPMSVKFWENQETALDGMKELADGWFARRHLGAQAALETAKRMGEAATPFDITREYQDWMKGAMERLMADGMACQQQFLKAGAQLGAHLPSSVNPAAKPDAQQSDERRSG
jgi:hypothetical protein